MVLNESFHRPRLLSVWDIFVLIIFLPELSNRNQRRRNKIKKGTKPAYIAHKESSVATNINLLENMLEILVKIK